MAQIKLETLMKYKALARDIMHELDNMTEEEKNNLHVSISQGNSKIGKCLNVSILPVITCGRACAGACELYCYDVRDCLRFPVNVLRARAVNTWLLIHRPAKFWAEIDAKMSRRRKNKNMRFNVGGELLNAAYFAGMVERAKAHPDFTLWTYTKKYKIVNDYIAKHGGSRAAAYPEYFNVMFSEWDGVPVENPYNLPVFSTILKAGNKNHGPEYFAKLYKCPGACQTCLKLRRGCVVGESTCNDEH